MEIPPFDRHLGVEFVRLGDGRSEVRLELQPHHLNKRGVAHGGVLTALLDSALGAAVIASIPKEWWCATVSLTTQFLAGAGAGTVTGRGRVVRRGRSVAFAAGELVDERGRVLAAATGNWHLWPYHPATGPAAGGPWVRLRRGREPLPVSKIVAVGRNYADHVVEMGNAPDVPPVLFFKPPSAIVHDGGTVLLPEGGGSVHHEVELVAVVGTAGRAIPEQRALEHVLGFAVGLDLTLRDLQGEAKKRGEPWSVAKGFDGSAPVSEVAPRDEVGDGSGLAIRLDVNGETRQSGNTSQMTRSVARLVADASRWITLERGDLLFTGTPAGVGPVRPGDRLEASIEGVGTLRVTIAGVE